MKWRLSVLSSMVVLLAILGMGVIKEFGNGIKYPAESGVNLTRYEGGLKKEEVYEKLEEMAKKNEMILFKPILLSDGSERAFLFGNAKDYLKNAHYSKDMKMLDGTEVTGMYYLNKNWSHHLEKELKDMGFQCKGGGFLWYMAPVAFFLGKNARSVAVWTLLFVFSVLLFAVKMMYLKTAMVRRGLGIFGRSMWRETVSDIGILTLVSVIVLGIFALWQGSVTSVFVKSFSLLVVVTLLCLVIISLIANGLFALNVRLMSATATLKNKKSQGLISYVWLLGILASVFIFELSVSEIIHISHKLRKEAKTLQHWEVAKEFATIEWVGGESERLTEGFDDQTMNKKRQLMNEEGARNGRFIQSFQKEGWLYSKPSNLWCVDSERMKRELKDSYYIQQLAQFGIDVKEIKLAEHIQYVNTGLIQKNKKIYPKNDYGKLSLAKASSPVVFYVPKKYESYAHTLKNFVDFEYTHDSSIDLSHSPVVIVPDQQKTFLFQHKMGPDGLLEKQEVEDKILVQLNLTEWPNENSLSTAFDNLVSNALFHQKQVKQNLSKAGLEKTFSSLSNASQNIRMKRKEVMVQLTGAIIALISLTIAQAFVLYQYIKLQIESRAKKITIWNVLGRSIVMELVKVLALLVVGIVAVSRFAYRYCGGHKGSVMMGVVAMYFFEIVVLAVFAWITLKTKRVQILKGDFEIL